MHKQKLQEIFEHCEFLTHFECGKKKPYRGGGGPPSGWTDMYVDAAQRKPTSKLIDGNILQDQ